MADNFVDSIITIPFEKNQYVDIVYPKSLIFLHHTASDASPFGVVDWWASTKEAVGTAFVIGGASNSKKQWADGGIYQCFTSNKASWHLGLKQVDLNRASPHQTSAFLNLDAVGIELCCWGGLTAKGQAFVSYANEVVPDNQIVEYKVAFRGYHHYQKYTDAQIESTRKLLLFLCDKYNIPKKYPGMAMFDICPAALQGVPGIYSHVSVRVDKQDCHPQKELIQMLDSL